MSIKVIIPASGIGERFGRKTPKQFVKIKNKEMLAHTIDKFHNIKSIDEIIISTRPEYFARVCSIIKKHKFKKVKKLVEGGKLRQESVYNALINLTCSVNDIILVHDAARPFVSTESINKIIKEAKKHECVVLGMPVSETIKKVNKKQLVDKTIEREGLWSIQTPQAFRYLNLMQAFERAMKDNFVGTDEAAIVEYAGYDVKVIKGESGNVKITLKEDFDSIR